MTLYRAKEGASFDVNGAPVFVTEGDLAEDGAPVLRSHAYLFTPLIIKFPNPHPRSAEDGAPVNPRKPATQAARSR